MWRVSMRNAHPLCDAKTEAVLMAMPLYVQKSGPQPICWLPLLVWRCNLWATRGRHPSWMLMAGALILIAFGVSKSSG